MGNARVTWMLLKERSQNGDRFLAEFGFVGLVFFGERNQGKAIEGTYFGITRILIVELLQCIGIGLNARLFLELAFLVENGGGGEEGLFARIRRMEFTGLLDFLAAVFELFVAREIPDLLIGGHGFSPVQSRTLRLKAESLDKGLYRF